MDTSLVIATIGTFDGVHLGHRALLGELKRVAEELGMRPAVVTFDPTPATVLRPDSPPVPQLTTTSERVAELRALGFEAIILLNFTPHLASLSAREFMELLRDKYAVSALVLGYDHHFGQGASMSFEEYRALGAELGMSLVRAEALSEGGDKISSSRIRRSLLSGQLEEANRLLGRSYSLSGQVVGGLQIGRSLGYPTANIKPDDAGKLIPQDGVYAVRVWLERCVCGARYSEHFGMLYIGDRPTLGGGLARTIEVNIFDLNADLYAQRVKIDFVVYIRANQRFESLEALGEQIARDEVAIRNIFNRNERT